MKIKMDNLKWEDICGPQGLQTWNDTTKDLGLCFQELFLQIPLYYVIAIISAYYVGYRKDWVIREKTQERAIIFRSFFVLALVFIPIIELYVFITKSDFVLYLVDYFAAGSSCLCWLVHFGYVLALKHRLGMSARGPLSQLILWVMAVILNLIYLRSNILVGGSVNFAIASLCCHVLYFLTLLPSSNSRPTYYSQCLVGSQHTHNEYTPLIPHLDEGILGTAMQGNGCTSKLTFNWVNPLLDKGMENKLNDLEELFDIPATYRCSYIGARMDRCLIGNVDRYQQFTEVPHEPFIASGYGATGETAPQSSTPVTPTSRVLIRPIRRQNVTLLRAMHSCFAIQFYSIGILKLISDMAGFAGPMLLNKLVTFVQDESIDQHYGYMYAAGLLSATLISALFNVHFNWLMSIIGLKMRGAIVSTILRKTLSVTSTELTKTFSVGEITNFMSTDTDRIVNSCPSFHALWSIPLQLIITLFLLYQQVGVSILAGVAFSILLIPINKVVANKIGELSTEMMKHKDTRVSLISDLLRGIRNVKLHVWESFFISKVSEARIKELKYLKWRKYLDAICVVFWATTPVLVAALTLGTHALRKQPLDAATVFTTIALINMLIAPLNAFPWVLNGLMEAWVSIKRIQKLLDLPDMDHEHYYGKINTNHDEDKVLILKNATFSWVKPCKRPSQPKKSKKNKGKSKKKLSRGSIQRRDSSSSSEIGADEPFMLKDISLEVGKEELIGVTGNIGSGKTSLLLAIIGEMKKKNGEIQIPENLTSFGYVSQKAWLIRGTIRDNILFGKAYDEVKFKNVVDACALTEDLNILGWNAYVGEGGCTLSGGQRARIALARAVYQEKQVYLLDDVLSGVDAAVSQHIMQRCILGLLRGTTRLMVTHSPRHLARTNLTILLHKGRIIKHGPPEAVMNDIEEYLPSESESIGEEPPRPVEPQVDDRKDVISVNSLEDEEAMSQGTVGWWVIGMYLRSVGVSLTIMIILSMILMQTSQNFTFLWLTYWVKHRSRNITVQDHIEDVTEKSSVLDHGMNTIDNLVHSIINATMSVVHKLEGHNATKENESSIPISEMLISPMTNITPVYEDDFYLEVYFGLAGLNLVFTIMRAFLFAYGGVVAAKRIHKVLLKVVVNANVKFFDVTPAGRIVNRFSSDTYTVDDSLPFIMNILLAQFFSLVGAVVVTVYGLPWLLLGVAPLAFVYYRLQRLYRVTSRQLKRLQSVTLSPVYTHFNDTLEGLTCIRSVGAGGRWAAHGEELVERWQRAALAGAAAAQWLALRLQAAASLAVAAAAALAVLQRSAHATHPGMVGLAISYALSMTSMLGNVLNAFTETEREMIAVERVGEYIREIKSENIDGDPPPYGWPSQGVIEFNNVFLKYSGRSSGSMALNGVTFSCYPGEKLGVVGRTGAGKSSLLHAITRLAPLSGGTVTVDGVDLAKLNLHALRSRIGVIPQEPFIFSGSIRENVDPLRQYGEAEIRRALEACGSTQDLAASADSLSRGHKQLLCLARAHLHRPKILLVDEATANLDPETERVILDTIRCSFGGSTVVYVAHRSAGVLECSRVLVMAGGSVAELRAPDDALADHNSHLYNLLCGS